MSSVLEPQTILLRLVGKVQHGLPQLLAHHWFSVAVTLYYENYCLKRCAVFLCYYVFTASIMHVTSRELPAYFVL